MQAGPSVVQRVHWLPLPACITPTRIYKLRSAVRLQHRMVHIVARAYEMAQRAPLTSCIYCTRPELLPTLAKKTPACKVKGSKENIRCCILASLLIHMQARCHISHDCEPNKLATAKRGKLSARKTVMSQEAGTLFRANNHKTSANQAYALFANKQG
jgi:hypothetical protein